MKLKTGTDYIPLYKALTLSKLLKVEQEVTGYYKCTPKGKDIITDLKGKEHEIDINTLEINFDPERPQMWTHDFELMYKVQFQTLTTSYQDEFYTVSQSAPGFYQQAAYSLDQQEMVVDLCEFLATKDIRTKVFKQLRLKDISTELKDYSEGIEAIGFMKV